VKTDAARGRLYDSLQVIRRRWDVVEPHWTDAVRQEFEANTLTPLLLLSEDFMRAIDRLGQVFAQARKDCSGGSDGEVFGS
jgi:hypothetical protein